MAGRLPSVVEVIAEHTDVFLWNRSPNQDPSEDDYVVLPGGLGISPELVARLEAWNVEWSRRALGLGTSGDSKTWERTGLRLAYELQAEFDALGHDIDVRYAHDDDPRPLRERRGR